MKGIPTHCSKSRENFVTFHYRILSTAVFETKTTRQEKGVKLHVTLTKLYIMFANTGVLTLSPGCLLNVVSEYSESIYVLI